jgi:hypothetical protein
MNVLHVVTLTPDGAHGGPVRVAFNQAREIRSQGHSVTITGACRGYREPPRDLDGTSVHLFKARQVIPFTGFAGIASLSVPVTTSQRRAHLSFQH